LPFFPLKEVSRGKEGDLTLIEVEQDPSIETFSLDIEKGKKFWEKTFLN
jgi:hypothetical protein